MTSWCQDAAFLYKGRQVLERAPPASQDTSQTTLATVAVNFKVSASPDCVVALRSALHML